jgi:hypothetical protein
MRKIALATLLAALASHATAQRATPAHSTVARLPAVPPTTGVRAGKASADFASFHKFRRSNLPGSFPYPFGWFPDSSYPDNPPPNVDPSPARPDLLLQALSSLGTNLGASQQASKPDSKSLLIELQGDRYLALTNEQPPNNSLQDGVARTPLPAAPQLTIIPHSGKKESPQAASASHDLLPVTLLFRDGHREDVRDYTIANGVLYARGDLYTDGYWNKKIELSTLDVPESVKSNEARGVRFVLPNSPNEVITRP